MPEIIIPDAARPAEWPLIEDESEVLLDCEKNLAIYKRIFGQDFGTLTVRKARMLMLFSDCRLSLAKYANALESALTEMEDKCFDLQRDLKVLSSSRDRAIVKMGKMEAKIQMLHNDLHYADSDRQLKSVDALLMEDE